MIMGRRKGSKNVKPSRTGRPRARCVLCGKRRYLGEMVITEKLVYKGRGMPHFSKRYRCADCSSPEIPFSCSKSCGPGDHEPGGKCDREGCL